MKAVVGFVIEHNPGFFSPLSLIAGRSVIGHVVDQLRLVDPGAPIVVSSSEPGDLTRWCRWSGIEIAEQPALRLAKNHNWQFFCTVSAHVALLPHREIYAALCLVQAGIDRVKVVGDRPDLFKGLFAELQGISAGEKAHVLNATGACLDPYLPALVDSQSAANSLSAAINCTGRMPAYLLHGDGQTLSVSPWRGKAGPLLIAEIGGNHEGNFDAAVNMTKKAINSGADCIKFQLYQGSSLVSPVESPDRHQHFKKFELSMEQHIKLAEMVRDAGLVYSASVWDSEMLDWIDPYLDFYKIGSGDLTAWPLLANMAKRGKPILLSTGLATLDDVVQTIDFIRASNPSYNRREMLCIMQCTSMYPIPDEDTNLRVIDSLRAYGVAVGYSDHTVGDRALIAASAMGAEVLEFHFTDRREGQSFRDHKVSLLQNEVLSLRNEIMSMSVLRGSIGKVPQQSEINAGHVQSFRRGVYPSIDIVKGDELSSDRLVCLRPASGTDARDYDYVKNSKAKTSIPAFSSLSVGLNFIPPYNLCDDNNCQPNASNQ